MTSQAPATPRPGSRGAFVRRRVRAGVPWTVAATELQLLLEWRGGLPAAALAWHAAACAVAVPLVYLAVVVGLARLEWRYRPLADRDWP